MNGFPHLAPAGDVAVYPSLPDGTAGHPADRTVRLVLVLVLVIVIVGDRQNGRVVAEFNGGQGTINVNS